MNEDIVNIVGKTIQNKRQRISLITFSREMAFCFFYCWKIRFFKVKILFRIRRRLDFTLNRFFYFWLSLYILYIWLYSEYFALSFNSVCR